MRASEKEEGCFALKFVIVFPEAENSSETRSGGVAGQRFPDAATFLSK
jgi:hypothetical protein